MERRRYGEKDSRARWSSLDRSCTSRLLVTTSPTQARSSFLFRFLQRVVCEEDCTALVYPYRKRRRYLFSHRRCVHRSCSCVAEETLKKLLLEQRAKVEQLKKKTDFYSTQKLLERYDRQDNTQMATPVKKGPMPAGPRSSLNPNGPGPGQNLAPPGMGFSTPVRPSGPPVNGASPTPMHPGYMSAYSRMWFLHGQSHCVLMRISRTTHPADTQTLVRSSRGRRPRRRRRRC